VQKAPAGCIPAAPAGIGGGGVPARHGHGWASRAPAWLIRAASFPRAGIAFSGVALSRMNTRGSQADDIQRFVEACGDRLSHAARAEKRFV